jgi:nitronate monooxygenase
MATLQRMLGIELSIIQAPMAGVQDSALAIAVSNAGGLGSLPCAMLSADTLRRELEAIGVRTSCPINLNFFCHVMPEPDAKREGAWRKRFGDYYAEFDLDIAATPSVPVRQPFGPEMAEIVREFKPAVVSFHFGLPSDDLLAVVRSAGARVLSSATTVEEALWLEARGVDAVIAQGVEAGGHRGMFLNEDINTQVGTFALLPQIVDALKVPVIAAGGITDARGVKAALALGAAAVQVGTAYLLCPEATTSAIHRAALRSEVARTTVLTNVFTGRPARGIVNRMVREVGPMSEIAPCFPLAVSVSAPLRAKAESRGSGDFSPLWAGQNVSGCQEIPAAELTRRLAGRA